MRRLYGLMFLMFKQSYCKTTCKRNYASSSCFNLDSIALCCTSSMQYNCNSVWLVDSADATIAECFARSSAGKAKVQHMSSPLARRTQNGTFVSSDICAVILPASQEARQTRLTSNDEPLWLVGQLTCNALSVPCRRTEERFTLSRS